MSVDNMNIGKNSVYGGWDVLSKRMKTILRKELEKQLLENH